MYIGKKLKLNLTKLFHQAKPQKINYLWLIYKRKTLFHFWQQLIF